MDVANNLEVKDHEEVKTRVAKRARMKSSSKNKEEKLSQETNGKRTDMARRKRKTIWRKIASFIGLKR